MEQKLQQDTMDKCHEYYNELSKEFGKKGFIWLKNDETGQLMVYTRREYTKQILDFLKSLDPNSAIPLNKGDALTE